MNWLNMCLQSVFLSKARITYIAFESFFSSWTDHIWLLKFAFTVKLVSQIMHLKDIFSWTDLTCAFKFYFCENPDSHLLHLKGFFPSWTDPMCFFKVPSDLKGESQISHLKGWSIYSFEFPISGFSSQIFCFIFIFHPCTIMINEDQTHTFYQIVRNIIDRMIFFISMYKNTMFF